jgi:hypothetical protein
MDSMPKVGRPPRRFMQATGLVLDDRDRLVAIGQVRLQNISPRA